MVVQCIEFSIINGIEKIIQVTQLHIIKVGKAVRSQFIIILQESNGKQQKTGKTITIDKPS